MPHPAAEATRTRLAEAGLATEVIEAIIEGGYVRVEYLAVAIRTVDDALQVLGDVRAGLHSNRAQAEELYGVIEGLRDVAAREVRRKAVRTPMEREMEHIERHREDHRLMLPEALRQPAKGSEGRWVNTYQRRLSEAGGPQQRRDAESAERDRWVKKLVALLEYIGAPVMAKVKASNHPEKSAMRLAGATRTRTLRTRMRGAQRLVDWTVRSHGTPWPTSEVEVLDYIDDQLAGGVGPTVPTHLYLGLKYIEGVGGWTLDRSLSAQALVEQAFDSMRLEAHQGGEVPRRSRRSSPGSSW